MTWREFLDVSRPGTLTKKDWEIAVEAVFYQLGRIARDSQTGIKVPKFGSFRKVERTGKAPITGKPYSARSVAFRASKHLKASREVSNGND